MNKLANRTELTLERTIFASRWIQAPLYLGLVIALLIYAVEFGIHVVELVTHVTLFSNNAIMLEVLDLIDVVMVANLMIMVIVGGYEVFVSRLNLQSHPDHPEWLDEVNAGTMKTKLALALVSISSIHLLRTFIDPSQKDFYSVMWQVVIHATLVLSAIGIAVAGAYIGKQK